MIIKAQKWGNSLGLRIPKPVADSTGLSEGSRWYLRVEEGKLVLSPVEVPSLDELLARIKHDMRPQRIDWGRLVGREVW